MIIVKMLGGLGNQMFQVAYALSLAEKYDRNVYLDLSIYDSYKIRSFSLDNLVLNERVSILSDKELNRWQHASMVLSQKIYHVFQKVLRLCGKDFKFGEYWFKKLSSKGYFYNFDNYYHEHEFQAEDNSIIYLYGYFQSELYFIDQLDNIRDLFSIKPSLNISDSLCLYRNQILSSERSIAISMRLGQDYTSSKIFNVCDASYFTNSLNYLLSREPNAVVFVFSDVVSEAKVILKDYENIVFVDECKDFQSLELMSLCDHFIISNSSFSWWGAYLSKYDDKLIIAPDNWYNKIHGNVDIYNNSITKFSDL
ncbi:alpha-1,2-fucosyltransferase [Vibrio alginolyticus]|uniref:alpha-1,2-fucosyltransferase n=1 Tax=Vibrio alginolyticus TaxID=663 RepID=UPI001BD2111A|nr:alpha-1,2-fucosyltransferase [Vibrio alginolyticus]MBS9898255.1 alpha-1,2-fucosyltransferase [Vibrio alginolyticus]